MVFLNCQAVWLFEIVPYFDFFEIWMDPNDWKSSNKLLCNSIKLYIFNNYSMTLWNLESKILAVYVIWEVLDDFDFLLKWPLILWLD